MGGSEAGAKTQRRRDYWQNSDSRGKERNLLESEGIKILLKIGLNTVSAEISA